MSLLEKDKRKFSVIICSKKCGTCSGASPSGAARKVKGKSGAFYLKETTKGSKKKLYGPYSSKKKIVQRGGNKEEICGNVLNILKRCDKIHKFDAEMYRINTQYSILDNAYLFLEIRKRSDKSDVLKDIIEERDKYFILNKETGGQKKFPLCHCLCNLTIDENNLAELGFINSKFNFITSRIKSLTKRNEDNFYRNNWLNFIKFLRDIIETINKEPNKDILKLQKEIQIERIKLLKEMKAQNAKNKFKKEMKASNLDGPAAAAAEGEGEGEVEEQRKYGTLTGKPLPAYLNIFGNDGQAEEKKKDRPPNHMLQAQAQRKVNQKPNEQYLSPYNRLLALKKD